MSSRAEPFGASRSKAQRVGEAMGPFGLSLSKPQRGTLGAIAAVVLLVAGCATSPPRTGTGGSGAVLTILPLTNLSGAADAPREVFAVLRDRLEKAGFAVSPETQVDAAIASRRLRYLDSLTAKNVRSLSEELGAAGLISGTILTYRERPQPAVALLLRLTSATGEALWSEVVALAPDDTAGVLELGKATTVEQLLPLVVGRALQSFPDASLKAAHAGTRGKPWLAQSPTRYRAKTLPKDGPMRICLLPLENRTANRQAAWAAAELLARRLAESGRYEVVPAAELREALIAEKIRTLVGISSEQLRPIAARVGTSLFLSGSVELFSEPLSASAWPEVEVELTLTDVTTARMVWSARHHRHGDDYEGLLRLGAITTAAGLADQVFAELAE